MMKMMEKDGIEFLVEGDGSDGSGFLIFEGFEGFSGISLGKVMYVVKVLL